MKQIQVRGMNFAYLEQGEGPLIMLLHGFPDNAQTWNHQMPALAAQGYRVIAPYLRGYPPTDLGEGGFYDKATLVADIAALIQAFGAGKPCHLVGQDWGAIIGYGVLAAYPELIARAVLMAVPHPGQVTQSLVDAKHIQRSFHWWFFQMPDLPEKALAANNLAFIDYRAMFDAAKADPALADLRALMARQIKVPTLALCGADDLRAELMQAQAQYFDNEYNFKLIANAGHFLHREQPQAVTQELLDWFKK